MISEAAVQSAAGWPSHCAPEPTGSERYHSLDALRAVALLLGILLHAGLAYLPGPGIGWAVQDPSKSWLIGAFVLVTHSFRLEVFFLMAGFFARLLYVRRGAGGFVANRALRVLLPFVAGWFLVFPWIVFAWVWGGSQGDPASAGAALRQAWGATVFSLRGLLHPVESKLAFPLTHLWFLYYLVLLYGVFLAGRGLFVSWLDRRGVWRQRIDRGVAAFVGSKWAIVMGGFITWPLLLTMKTWSVDTPDKTFWLQPPVLTLFGVFFALGWFLHRQAGLLEIIRRRWRTCLACAVVVTLPVLALCLFEGQTGNPRYREIRLIYLLLYAVMMWSWVLALLGLFLRFVTKESRCLRYLSDSSYWLYILHLPVVVLLQVALARWPISCWLKLGICMAGTCFIGLVTYHYLVRWTPVGWVLNGRRYPFTWLPR
jgi:peptidoglycan/LPS O-acetylase OafA/YrhL